MDMDVSLRGYLVSAFVCGYVCGYTDYGLIPSSIT